MSKITHRELVKLSDEFVKLDMANRKLFEIIKDYEEILLKKDKKLNSAIEVIEKVCELPGKYHMAQDCYDTINEARQWLKKYND